MGEPTAFSVVPLNYIYDNCLFLAGDSVDVRGRELVNVKEPVALTDSTNKYNVGSNCLQYEKREDIDIVVDARNHRIILVREQRWPIDVANKQYVDKKNLLSNDHNVSNRRLTGLASLPNGEDADTQHDFQSVRCIPCEQRTYRTNR